MYVYIYVCMYGQDNGVNDCTHQQDFLKQTVKTQNLFFTFALCPNAFLDVSKVEANSTIKEVQCIP